jgi:hypothetical protein
MRQAMAEPAKHPAPELDDAALSALISRLAREIPQQQSLLHAARRELRRRRRTAAKEPARP